MWKYNLLVLFFLFLISFSNYCISSSDWDESNDVITLTNENFKTKTKEYDVLLVMFYAKWCPHCRRLHPDYERAGTILSQNEDSPIYIAKLDCSDSYKTQCPKKYAINGYPALRIYRYGHFNGEELNYRNRTTDEIVRTMKALKKESGQRQDQPIWFNSDQNEGIKDEVNKAVNNVQSIWLFIGSIILSYIFV